MNGMYKEKKDKFLKKKVSLKFKSFFFTSSFKSQGFMEDGGVYVSEWVITVGVATTRQQW